jgi:mono/diheme cytochrome c family protein
MVGGELTARSRVEGVPENPERANDTLEALGRGKKLYDRFCAACHGEDAAGKELTEDFESPDLTEDEYLELLDGDIYTLMVEGGLSMPHYRAEIEPKDRWLIINYFRTLQRANDR